MAQVMVNFRMDEDVKKNMEQVCREMGLSMTAAFTIFATKVGKEKRIPFEITAEPRSSELHRWPSRTAEIRQGRGEEAFALMRKQDRLEALCTQIRQSLTSIHTAIPSSITGLSMERIRLLCGNELKDKTAKISKAAQALFSSRNTEMLREKDLNILDEYTDSLSSISTELQQIEHTLIPAMKSWQGEDTAGFEQDEQRLAAVSQKLDGLSPVMQRFLCSTACNGGTRAVQARLRQAAGSVETAYVLTALESLEALVLRHYDSLEEPTKARLESDYLQTLELTLRELGRTEQSGGDAVGKAALCLRAINVVSQVISDNAQARQEWNGRSLEAEVAALERLAAMRGDIGGGINPEA
ncbi:MAG: type II toxin-antitoxin system RelB/DinJ family antitoxin [Clostridiales bacterium]|nr:type II toxin-antitoxin system RelB/DinJ family antitoxin [Clostridiales bacterium]